MSLEDRTRWEERHRRALNLAPRPIVAELEAVTAGSLALDLACGQGRHSVSLARSGYSVVAFDVAGPALAHTKTAMRSEGIGAFLTVQGDIDEWPFAPESFDLIVQVDFLERALFPSLKETLRAGGLLLIDTFLDLGRRNAEGPSNPAFLLSPGELPVAFGDFEILRYAENDGETARAALLARKR